MKNEIFHDSLINHESKVLRFLHAFGALRTSNFSSFGKGWICAMYFFIYAFFSYLKPLYVFREWPRGKSRSQWWSEAAYVGMWAGKEPVGNVIVQYPIHGCIYYSGAQNDRKGGWGWVRYGGIEKVRVGWMSCDQIYVVQKPRRRISFD